MSRVLALDIGTVRVGIAISDPSKKLALPLESINMQKNKDVFEQIAAYCTEYDVDCVVVGLPLLMDGQARAAVRRTRRFVEGLRPYLEGMRFYGVDERLSSAAAERAMQNMGIKSRDYHRHVDSIAAALILEGYLGGAIGELI
ncbi:MAG: Holliday junction resolvase RuvX [Bradymonadales bacterium]|jgi:putative Holliday junction resolvase